MSPGELGGVAGMVPGETPGPPKTGAAHETPATPARTYEPVTGWLCLHCATETPGDCAKPVPCCTNQFAMRIGFRR